MRGRKVRENLRVITKPLELRRKMGGKKQAEMPGVITSLHVLMTMLKIVAKVLEMLHRLERVLDEMRNGMPAESTTGNEMIGDTLHQGAGRVGMDTKNLAHRESPIEMEMGGMNMDMRKERDIRKETGIRRATGIRKMKDTIRKEMDILKETRILKEKHTQKETHTGREKYHQRETRTRKARHIRKEMCIRKENNIQKENATRKEINTPRASRIQKGINIPAVIRTRKARDTQKATERARVEMIVRIGANHLQEIMKKSRVLNVMLPGMFHVRKLALNRLESQEGTQLKKGGMLPKEDGAKSNESLFEKRGLRINRKRERLLLCNQQLKKEMRQESVQLAMLPQKKVGGRTTIVNTNERSGGSPESQKEEVTLRKVYLMMVEILSKIANLEHATKTGKAQLAMGTESARWTWKAAKARTETAIGTRGRNGTAQPVTRIEAGPIAGTAGDRSAAEARTAAMATGARAIVESLTEATGTEATGTEAMGTEGRATGARGIGAMATEERAIVGMDSAARVTAGKDIEGRDTGGRGTAGRGTGETGTDIAGREATEGSRVVAVDPRIARGPGNPSARRRQKACLAIGTVSSGGMTRPYALATDRATGRRGRRSRRTK